MLTGLGGPGERADLDEVVDDVLAGVVLQALDESLVGEDGVVADKRRGLVQSCPVAGIHTDTVGRMARSGQGGLDFRGRGTALLRTRPLRVITKTIGTCFENRVTGLAAEGAFFALLSLPPLLFGFAGSVGYLFQHWLSETELSEFRTNVLNLAAKAFTDDAVTNVIAPTLDDVLSGPRISVISIGFVLALWSGSRALNVFVDTITIMSGLGGHRGIIGTRALVVRALRARAAHRRGDDPAGSGGSGSRGLRRPCSGSTSSTRSTGRPCSSSRSSSWRRSTTSRSPCVARGEDRSREPSSPC